MNAGQPVAAWRGRTFTTADLQPALIELAGNTALRDALLDFRLDQALAERSITLGSDAVERERALLMETLDADPSVASRLLSEIRTNQGLGPVRFEQLLRRNASLRALVQPDVRLTAEALARQHESMYGPKRVCRVISVSTAREAEEIRAQLASGVAFAELATRRSTDSSAARGGLLAPIARTDPSWPESFRTGLFALAAGETSAPILVEEQYLIVQFVEERPGDGSTLDGRRRQVESALRLAQERVLMEDLARGYLSEMRPTIYDSSFNAAWRETAR